MSTKNLDKFKSSGQRNTDKAKKAIIITLIVCIILAAGYFCVPLIKQALNRDVGAGVGSYRFYPIDWDEDIMEDQVCLSLDRNFYFEDPSYGTTISFDSETLDDIPSEYAMPVELLVRYINAAIEGNDEAIGELYSEQFFDNGFVAKKSFTPQKIYETTFTIYESDTVTEDGENWDRWIFWVSYKIRRNNGTFRNDMESDCSRKELFVITYRDGKMEIDGVTPYRTE